MKTLAGNNPQRCMAKQLLIPSSWACRSTTRTGALGSSACSAALFLPGFCFDFQTASTKRGRVFAVGDAVWREFAGTGSSETNAVDPRKKMLNELNSQAVWKD